MIKIAHLFLKQKEIFNKLTDERLKKTTDLDKKMNPDNLIYKWKGPSADIKFDEFDNALSILHKIKEDEISLAKGKNDQIRFKSNLVEVKKGNKKIDQKRKKHIVR